MLSKYRPNLRLVDQFMGMNQNMLYDFNLRFLYNHKKSLITILIFCIFPSIFYFESVNEITDHKTTKYCKFEIKVLRILGELTINLD